MTNKDIDKKAKELFQIAHPSHDFEKNPCDLPENYIYIARHLLACELRARIDEIDLNMTCDSERLNKKRIKELQEQLKFLESGNE